MKFPSFRTFVHPSIHDARVPGTSPPHKYAVWQCFVGGIVRALLSRPSETRRERAGFPVCSSPPLAVCALVFVDATQREATPAADTVCLHYLCVVLVPPCDRIYIAAFLYCPNILIQRAGPELHMLPKDIVVVLHHYVMLTDSKDLKSVPLLTSVYYTSSFPHRSPLSKDFLYCFETFAKKSETQSNYKV
ncbi:hypothetical protein CBL_04279 [Carabus blaptoides fortunei]